MYDWRRQFSNIWFFTTFEIKRWLNLFFCTSIIERDIIRKWLDDASKVITYKDKLWDIDCEVTTRPNDRNFKELMTEAGKKQFIQQPFCIFRKNVNWIGRFLERPCYKRIRWYTGELQSEQLQHSQVFQFWIGSYTVRRKRSGLFKEIFTESTRGTVSACLTFLY